MGRVLVGKDWPWGEGKTGLCAHLGSIPKALEAWAAYLPAVPSASLALAGLQLVWGACQSPPHFPLLFGAGLDHQRCGPRAH